MLTGGLGRQAAKMKISDFTPKIAVFKIWFMKEGYLF